MARTTEYILKATRRPLCQPSSPDRQRRSRSAPSAAASGRRCRPAEDLDVAARPLAPAGDLQRALGLGEQAVIADRRASSKYCALLAGSGPVSSAHFLRISVRSVSLACASSSLSCASSLFCSSHHAPALSASAPDPDRSARRRAGSWPAPCADFVLVRWDRSCRGWGSRDRTPCCDG